MKLLTVSAINMKKEEGLFTYRKQSIVLAILVVLRTYLTLVPSSNLTISLFHDSQVYIKINDVISIQIGIWFSISSFRSLRLFYYLYKLKPLTVLSLNPKLVILSTVILVYDLWLIWFIYSIWTSDLAIGFQLFELIPALSLLIHSKYQVYFIAVEHSEVIKQLQSKRSEVQQCINFNASLIVHLICTTYLDIAFQTPGRVFGSGRILSFFQFCYHFLAIRKFKNIKNDDSEWQSKTPAGLTTLDSTVMEFKKDTKAVQWNGYGISIEAPKRMNAKINVSMVRSKEFEFPEGTQLVSSAFFIQSFPAPLQHSIELKMEHCVNIESEEQCRELMFGICKKKEPPYKFHIVKDGSLVKFHKGSKYGTLTTNSFSMIVILMKEVIGLLSKKEYFAGLYYPHNNNYQLPTVIYLNIASNTESEKTVMRMKQYNLKHKRGSEINHIHLSTSSKYIEMKLQVNDQILSIPTNFLNNKWRLSSLSTLKFDDVFSHNEPEEKRLQLKKLNSSSESFPDDIYIFLSGAEPENNRLLINYPFEHLDDVDLVPTVTTKIRSSGYFSGAYFNIATFIFGISVGIAIAMLCNSWSYSIPRSTTIPQPYIQNLEELLLELPRQVTRPAEFCICLQLPFVAYQKTIKDHPLDVQRQSIELVSTWYRRHLQVPKWDKFVQALLCIEYCQEAYKLASKKGVDVERILHDKTVRTDCKFSI